MWEGDPAGLWKTDGTTAGTLFIKSVSNPSQLTASGGYLYYTTLEDDLMQPLHVSDGIARPEDSWAATNWGNGYAWGNLTDVGGTLFTTVGFNTDPENQLGWDIQYWDCSLYDGDCTQYLWLKRRHSAAQRGVASAIRQVHDLTRCWPHTLLRRRSTSTVRHQARNSGATKSPRSDVPAR